MPQYRSTMRYICPEERERTNNATLIWHGRGERCKYNMVFLIQMLCGSAIILMIVGMVMALAPVDQPDGYGYVWDMKCNVINFEDWCTYTIGVLNTPNTCTLECEGLYHVNETIPINVDGTKCSIWTCSRCDSPRMGHILLYIAVAIFGSVALYFALRYARIKLTRPDDIQHDLLPESARAVLRSVLVERAPTYAVVKLVEDKK